MAQPRIQEADFASVADSAGDAGSLIGFRTEKRTVYHWMDGTGGKTIPALLVTGPSGSGKTRLVRAALSRARRKGVVACRGACEAMHGPFSPVVEALREAEDERSPPVVRERLARCLARRPELATLVGMGSDPVSNVTPNEVVSKSSLFQAVAQACFVLCTSGPALLVLEDCHNADDVTIEYVRYLATRARVHSLKLLITFRTDPNGAVPQRIARLAETLEAEATGNRMSLGGLTESETDNLIRSLYPRNLFSADLKRGLVEATAGNPSAIQDALGLYEVQGIIYLERGVWRQRRRPKGNTTPGQLYDSLVDRLERLSDEVVQVLRLAALSGHTADPAVLQIASGANRVRFMRALGVLARIHGVLEPVDQAYAFTSETVRVATIVRTPPKEAIRLHAALAQAIASAHPGTRQEYVEAIAEHYVEAGDLENAIPCLMEAAGRAARFASHGRAIGFYERSVEMLKESRSLSASGTMLQVLNGMARAQSALKRWPDSEQTYRQMAALAHRSDSPLMEAKAWHGLGRNCSKRKHYAPALRHYGKALELFIEEEDALNQCTTLIEMGTVHLEQGKHDDLEAAHGAALAIAREQGFTVQVAGLTMNRAMRHAMRGDYGRATRDFERCLALNRRLDRREATLSALINLGKCRADAGDTQAAKRHYLSALRLASRHYDTQREAIARLNLSEILLAEGRLDLCQQTCSQALSRFEEIDHRIGIADASRILGRTAQKRGDHYGAFNLLEKSIAHNLAAGYRLGEAEARRDYGRYLDQTSPGSATGREQMQEAREIFRELGVEKEVEGLDCILGGSERREREPVAMEHDGRSGPPPVQKPVPSLNQTAAKSGPSNTE